MAYAWAVPIPKGKTEAFRRLFAEIMGPRREGYDAFQRRQGVQAERYYVQAGPDGDTLIVVGEGEEQLTSLADALDLSQPWDQWFRQQNLEIFGIDLTEMTDAAFSEQLGEWRAR